ncbi:MAG: TVP38/TMEM64 family protein [Planctomycetes bacterium]|nr:TVP38/TMEM64 family protein [Planctomycetota bacterium]
MTAVTREKQAAPPDAAVERGGEGLPATPSSDIVRASIFAGVVLLCLGLVYATPLRHMFDMSGVAEMSARMDAYGAAGPLFFVALSSFGIAFGVPRLFLAAVAGAAFGFLEGLCLISAATMAGCLITFLLGRRFGRDMVKRRFADRRRRLRILLDQLERHGIAGCLLIRAAPVGNCFVANLLMAVSPISTRDFLIGTFLGTTPETVICCLLGSSAHGHFAARIAGGVLLIVALTVCYWIYTRRSRLAREISMSAAGKET